MKVLWIVNITLPEAVALLTRTNASLRASGGWIMGAAEALLSQPDVVLTIASTNSRVKELTKLQGEKIEYYLVPIPNGDKKYDAGQEKYWRAIKEEVQPDLIHIHGTEYAHSLAFVRACGSEHVCISIQGLKSAYYYYYYYGISEKDIYQNITFRDVIKGNLIKEKEEFRKSGDLEKEVIASVHHIIGRTSWDRAHTWAINPNAQYYLCNETLRKEFYDGSKWQYEKCNKHTIFLSQAVYPLKGLHQMLRAMPVILHHYPDAKIRVAGGNITSPNWLRIHGYGKIIKNILCKLNITNKVTFIGSLDAEQMKQEYLQANVFVCPSAIENSPNSLGEAQILGTPCVASYVGGIMDMMKDNEENLYRFEEIDMLAYKVCDVFRNKNQQVDNSEMAKNRHNPETNAQTLLKIYEAVMCS